MSLDDGPNNFDEVMEAFNAFDKTGNGCIVADDLKLVLTTMGKDRLTDEEAQTMINIADKDGDGVLDYDELVAVLTNQHMGIEKDMARYSKSQAT